MAVRAGVGALTLIDPDTFTEENLCRHVLDFSSVRQPKVVGMEKHLRAINPELHVTALRDHFDGVPIRPDLVLAASDSYQCSSRVNGYALRENVPAVFAGVWGPAKVAEALYVVPGKTPCYECFASFRKGAPEIPNDPRRYTDVNFDATKVPGQEGLWCNVLMAAAMQFQIVLGLFGLRDCIDYEHTLWLMNISDYESTLQPLAVTFGKVHKGCAVCDESELGKLGSDVLAEGFASSMAPWQLANVSAPATRRSWIRHLRYLRYLHLTVYRRILHMFGRHDPKEPFFPEYLTDDEVRAICSRMKSLI